MYRFLFFAAFFVSFAAPAHAQNTGGVFGPSVKEGHRSLQYRAVIDPDNSMGETGFAQRLHYQQAIDGTYMWRVIGQTRKTNSSDFDFDFVQAELFWELTEDGADHQSGLRVDFRIRDGSRPEQFGINWTNGFKLAHDWSARAVLLASVQVGSRASSGVNLQTRSQLARKLGNGQSIGLEMFNNYGNTGNFGGFSKQSHTLGPIFSSPLAKKYLLFTGVLFGVSDAAPDAEFRLWLTRTL